MNSPEQPVTIPLEYATELAMEMHLMRGECSEVASELMQDTKLDEIGLEECAVLDEALAKAQRVLQAALGRIQRLRGSRNDSRQ